MIKSCKIRIYPNKTQENTIHKTLSGCRYIHNLYLEHNIQRYKECGEFLSGYDFSKIVTKLKKKEEKYHWLKDISSKALKDAIMNAEKSFKRFFHKQSKFPHFKSKRKRPVCSYYFIKDNIHYTKDKNIIKLPILGKIRITEKSYLPDRSSIISGRIVYSHNKYYVVFLYEMECKEKEIISCGIGLDLGIKEYATVYDGKNSFVFHSYLKDKKYLYLTKRIENLQQVLSKKAEINYTRKYQEYFLKHDKEPNETRKNIMKGESYNHTSIRKIRDKINKLYEKRNNYTNNKILSYINILVRAKPEYITIEDLNISKLLQKDKNKTLHRHIQDSKWYYFITRLIEKCKEYQIEIRKAYKFYASSKTCSVCGYKKKDLSLSDRVFICPECGISIDRDINASINLKYTKKYVIC